MGYAKVIPLLMQLHAVRMSMDGVRANKHNLTDIYIKGFFQNTAAWAFGQLETNGEALLPIDYLSRADEGHATLLFLKKRASEVVSVSYFETAFTDSRSVSTNLVRLLQVSGEGSSKSEDRGQLIDLANISELATGQACHGSDSKRILPVLCGEFRMQSLKHYKIRKKDVRWLAKLIGVEFEQEWDNNKSVHDRIIELIQKRAPLTIPKQRPIRPQYPSSCEFTSLKAFLVFYLEDELVFQVAQRAILINALRRIAVAGEQVDPDKKLAWREALATKIRNNRDRISAAVSSQPLTEAASELNISWEVMT
jgi:hypothetical protein